MFGSEEFGYAEYGATQDVSIVDAIKRVLTITKRKATTFYDKLTGQNTVYTDKYK